MTGMFLNNPHYTEIVHLLKQLHLLSRENRGESEEAEAIREEMDSHWYKLEPQEMALVKIMSADLRMIEGKEVFRPVPPQERTREWLGPKLAEAHSHQDWVSVLTLLRNGPDFLSPDRIAYLRGQGYTSIGHPDIGLLFLEFATQLKPDDYSTILMSHLVQLGQIREGAALAELIIKDKNIHPHELITAVHVLVLSTRPMPDQDRKVVLEKVLPVLTTAIEQDAKLPAEEKSDITRMSAYLILGQIYDWLGQTEQALNAYNHVLGIYPENADALTMRGTMLLHSDRETAENDFEQAVKTNTVNVIPYLVLANKALMQGDYQKCLNLCSRALDLTRRPSTVARILSWIAIANIYLGAEPGAIERLFEQAIAFDPLNEDIRRNYDIFRKERNKIVHSSGIGWQTGLPMELIRQEELLSRSYAVA